MNALKGQGKLLISGWAVAVYFLFFEGKYGTMDERGVQRDVNI
jgi:hypothetical protein